MMNKDQLKFVARVIYSEAGPTCEYGDRMVVALTIWNRRLHPGFPSISNSYQVVNQPNAFSCIDDKHNSNWKESSEFVFYFGDDWHGDAWAEACYLASVYPEGNGGKILEVEWLAANPVYYHDMSIPKPTRWDNKWWKTIRLGETPHFTLYAAIHSE